MLYSAIMFAVVAAAAKDKKVICICKLVNLCECLSLSVICMCVSALAPAVC